MSNRSLIADHAAKSYFQIGKWPVFAPPGLNRFIKGKSSIGDGHILDLSNASDVEQELAYWRCNNIPDSVAALALFAKDAILILLNEEHDDYFRVEESYVKIGQLT